MDERIKRLRNNEYAMVQAYQRLKKAIREVNEKDTYASICEVLLWVITTNDWHVENKELNPDYKKRQSKDPNGQKIFGLRHAHNLMKHQMNFYTIHDGHKGGVRFPIKFPLKFPPPYAKWAILTFDMEKCTKDLKQSSAEQANNYRKYSEGEDVLVTLDAAIEYLKREGKRIKD